MVAVASALGVSALQTNAVGASPLALQHADRIVAAAACVGPNAIATGEMLVDGVPVTFGDAKTFVNGGSTVTVNFTVHAGCDATQFGLAAYSNPVDTADPTYEDVAKQTYLTSQVVTKAAGQSGTLTVTLPEADDCRYQVDFFSGQVLTKLGNGSFYGSPEARLISVTHVELPDCVDVLPEETSTTTSTSTTSTTQLLVTPNETVVRPTTTLPGDVQAQATETTLGATVSDPPATVADETLAKTGAETLPLVGAGAAFAIAGGALTVFASAVRRRRAAYGGRHYR